MSTSNDDSETKINTQQPKKLFWLLIVSITGSSVLREILEAYIAEYFALGLSIFIPFLVLYPIRINPKWNFTIWLLIALATSTSFTLAVWGVDLLFELQWPSQSETVCEPT